MGNITNDGTGSHIPQAAGRLSFLLTLLTSFLAAFYE